LPVNVAAIVIPPGPRHLLIFPPRSKWASKDVGAMAVEGRWRCGH